MRNKQAGFTLIELMVALVVSGILMASLVSLSGSVQRSFGQTQDTLDLQSRLRYAMKRMVDDITRAGYMASPRAKREVDCRADITSLDLGSALQFQSAPQGGFELSMRANYLSSQRLRFLVDPVNRTRGELRCNNGWKYTSASRCGVGNERAASNPNVFYMPFGFFSTVAAKQSAYDQLKFGLLFPDRALFWKRPD